MDHKYYVQAYAKKRVDAILPVPDAYPLRGEFGAGFVSEFSALTALLKRIYADAAAYPGAYACELYPLDSAPRGRGVDNESNGSLDRIVKCLRVLCDCGETEDGVLRVRARAFKKQIKKVKNHTAILEKLEEFGFCFALESADCLSLAYPDRPGIIAALKIYMDCWNDVLHDEYIKSEIKRNGYGCIAYYYDYYLFDYKVTADPGELDPAQAVKDDSFTWDAERKNTYINFYEYAKKYPAIRFSNGDYYIGKKRVCTFRYDDRREFLKLKLRNPGKYIAEIERLTAHLQTCFSGAARKCSRCGCLGNDPDACNNRICWRLDGVDYVGCSMDSFYFNDIKTEDIPRLFALLACEYDIKINQEETQCANMKTRCN
ncbi:MAG: hypothetical protein FWF10_08195 [Clostridiales bacterium]|nr:hypothetical protein [Clostridiales bacterium]